MHISDPWLGIVDLSKLRKFSFISNLFSFLRVSNREMNSSLVITFYWEIMKMSFKRF